MSERKGTIAVAGAIAQWPDRGGHAWVFLQYLLGLRRLGWDVLFIDRLEPGVEGDASYVARVMDAFELPYTVLDHNGLSRLEVVRRLKDSELLLNVMGYLGDEELLALPRLRAFLDIDPGFPQMWQALGLAAMLRGHDAYVTVGQNVGRPGCTIPTCDIEWVTTAPPIVLEHWPWTDGDSASITGIGTWRGPYGPVRFDGVDYGLRVHEFRRLAELPRRAVSPCFEYALDIDPGDAADVDLLTAGGWRLRDPRRVAGTPARYRDYVQGSMAELMVAKSMYVRSRSGWFSDRSACYLASGRPVIAQDTGRTEKHDAGLLAFTTADEALDAVRRVIGDYERHRRAAREIAETDFDSDAVLTRLLDKVLAA